MTIPDKLITAAAITLCPPHPLNSRYGPCDNCMEKARKALAAAFAALPECEEAKAVLWTAMFTKDEAFAALAALARMATDG